MPSLPPCLDELMESGRHQAEALLVLDAVAIAQRLIWLWTAESPLLWELPRVKRLPDLEFFGSDSRRGGQVVHEGRKHDTGACR